MCYKKITNDFSLGAEKHILPFFIYFVLWGHLGTELPIMNSASTWDLRPGQEAEGEGGVCSAPVVLRGLLV
jgi:hypothetical protein